METLAGLARRLALRACAVAPEREPCSGSAATSSTHCPPLSPHSPLHPPPPARTPVTASRAASPGDQPSASSTSAVAIDNKIEQAMDLVKSHLMFAVREEVEVLKERIAELMERINQLELENTILKQHASQETLAQLGSSKGTVAATQGSQQPTPQGQASLSQGQQTQPTASQVAPTSANNPTPMV